jgi:hypothetical protein
MVDWTKPIQFRNGESCELVETRPEGWTQWGSRKDGAYPTRHIHRLGIDESSTGGIMSAHWFMHEDGKGPSLGGDSYDVINVLEKSE